MPASVSTAATRPPATISSPMNTTARNWAETDETHSASPAQATTAAAMWPIVNMPCAMMPGNPTPRANASSWCSGF